jgi:predicted AlkP superfamily phosphohydrolase/phosphomutase
VKRVIVIGIDGMDPHLFESFMGRGFLPSFSGLVGKGSYSPLATVNPPQSPVAWASIATGSEPVEHGVFDFLHRRPANYEPYLSILSLEGFRYACPVKRETFWEKAARHAIPSVIVRWPAFFPPRKTLGRVLSGMGVPDIKGTLGTYTFYTSDGAISREGKKGRVVHAAAGSGRFETVVYGPVVPSLKGRREATVPLSIEVREGGLALDVGGRKLNLASGTWSPWIPVKFSIGLLKHLSGLVKCFAATSDDGFSLYMTPVNMAPRNTNFALSTPQQYALDMEEAIGPYATLGIPEDTNGLNDGVIDEAAFLAQTSALLDERERMCFHELDRFKEGIFACVFDTVDRIQHMFWRLIEPENPLYNGALAGRYGTVIESLYARMDTIMGRVLERAGGDDLIVVCSDHGFASLYGNVHLNDWLHRNGYLALAGESPSSGGLFDRVDWSRTRAYALGLNSLYLNIRDREGQGIVAAGDAASLRDELKAGLGALCDGGRPCVRNVHDGPGRGSKTDVAAGPDLIVGYEKAYRSSWQSALGQVTGGPLVEINDRKWSGEHCCDADLVPGVLFARGASLGTKPSVLHIAPLILDYLGCGP